ncbi:oxygen-independent coproporphyrinogen III oxidase [Aegicerativicinus sediminis]|uniref:oxygen-independent coproporphyrinogen III oxidase n=1 Tax=Aegicerativicinus sediminis TaxID=2893202 RepID=UPI001E565BC4|nr:oxygen-independent coproporphyrinogen III oxidase [Aegicerativicinus sediminis]
MSDLISKYNVAGPRYTSYPTVPYWDSQTFSLVAWKESIQKSFAETKDSEGISIYIHLPFCESMCTFCGCTKRITKNHLVERPYVEALIKEFSMYRQLLGYRPKISQLHLGGGTPTFFSVDNLERLFNGIFKLADRAENVEFSFEGHPNNTSEDQLALFRKHGFTRVSYGVQDYNDTVQKAINRIQSFNQVKHITETSRKFGYESVGHDIIFGLPFQTLDNIKNTISNTIELRPDRIAFYSYAHVPWMKGNGQRGYREEDLPEASLKFAQYQWGKEKLIDSGYVEIGMDHFALPSDDLTKSFYEGKLHRNFMGYTISKSQLMIGLGVSSIGDSWYGFAQNVKGLDEYYHLISNEILPVFRGHILNSEDLAIRRHILNIMCNFKTSWQDDRLYFEELPEVLVQLKVMEEDGLIEFGDQEILVTSKGKQFVRNVCMPFDRRLQRNKPETQLFSMTV